MQSNFFRNHFGLEWEKRKFVRRVHAKRILQTAPHKMGRKLPGSLGHPYLYTGKTFATFRLLGKTPLEIHRFVRIMERGREIMWTAVLKINGEISS